jgi:hypothetical protein
LDQSVSIIRGLGSDKKGGRGLGIYFIFLDILHNVKGGMDFIKNQWRCINTQKIYKRTLVQKRKGNSTKKKFNNVRQVVIQTEG